MLTPPSQWRVLSMCGRCLGGTTSSLGLFPLKMGGAGGTPPIFWRKSPEDKIVRRKRGRRIHRRAWKQERDFFLFFPARSARPSCSRARRVMSELAKIQVKTDEEKRTACPDEGSPPSEDGPPIRCLTPSHHGQDSQKPMPGRTHSKGDQ